MAAAADWLRDVCLWTSPYGNWYAGFLTSESGKWFNVPDMDKPSLGMHREKLNNSIFWPNQPDVLPPFDILRGSDGWVDTCPCAFIPTAWITCTAYGLNAQPVFCLCPALGRWTADDVKMIHDGTWTKKRVERVGGERRNLFGIKIILTKQQQPPQELGRADGCGCWRCCCLRW